MARDCVRMNVEFAGEFPQRWRKPVLGEMSADEPDNLALPGRQGLLRFGSFGGHTATLQVATASLAVFEPFTASPGGSPAQTRLG